MATATRAQNIVDLAADADELIGELRTILESIEAEEAALFNEAAASGAPVNDTIAGRRRLAQYAQGQAFRPQWPKTTSEIAAEAWAEYL